MLCERLPTKPSAIRTDNQEIIQRIERLSLEKNIGFPVWDYCSSLEYELLLVRQGAKEAYERMNGIRTQNLIEALCKRG